MVLSSTTEAMNASVGSVKSGSQGAMIGKMVFDFLSKASMNEVWSMINSLQLVVYTPLVPLNFPGNAVAVFQQVINIATFDVIPKDDWYPVWFSLPIDKPFNERFGMLGLGSHFWIMNMGTLFLAFFVLKVQMMLYAMTVLYLGLKDVIFCRKIKKFLKDDLFWNSVIRFTYASYIELVFAFALNTYEFQWVSWGCYYSNIIFFFFVPVAVLAPYAFMYMLYRNYDVLQYRETKEMTGTAYEDIELFSNQRSSL